MFFCFLFSNSWAETETIKDLPVYIFVKKLILNFMPATGLNLLLNIIFKSLLFKSENSICVRRIFSQVASSSQLCNISALCVCLCLFFPTVSDVFDWVPGLQCRQTSFAVMMFSVTLYCRCTGRMWCGIVFEQL